jgi:hypothetical protein
MGVLTNSSNVALPAPFRDHATSIKEEDLDHESDVTDDMSSDYDERGTFFEDGSFVRGRGCSCESIGRGFYADFGAVKSSFAERIDFQNAIIKQGLELALLGVAVSRDLRPWRGRGVTNSNNHHDSNVEQPQSEHPKRLAIRNLQAFIKEKTAASKSVARSAFQYRWDRPRRRTKVYFDGRRLDRRERCRFGARSLFWQHTYQRMRELAKQQHEAKYADADREKTVVKKTHTEKDTQWQIESMASVQRGTLLFPITIFHDYDQISVCEQACTGENLAELLRDMPALVERIPIAAIESSKNSKENETVVGSNSHPQDKAFRTLPLIEVIVTDSPEKKDVEKGSEKAGANQDGEVRNAAKTTGEAGAKKETPVPPKFRFVDPEMQSLIGDLFALAEREVSAEMSLARKEKHKKRKAFSRKAKREESSGTEADDEHDSDASDDTVEDNDDDMNTSTDAFTDNLTCAGGDQQQQIEIETSVDSPGSSFNGNAMDVEDTNCAPRDHSSSRSSSSNIHQTGDRHCGEQADNEKMEVENEPEPDSKRMGANQELSAESKLPRSGHDECKTDSDDDLGFFDRNEYKFSGGRFRGFNPDQQCFVFDVPSDPDAEPMRITTVREFRAAMRYEQWFRSNYSSELLDSEKYTKGPRFLPAHSIKDEYSGPPGKCSHRFSRFCNCVFCNEYRKKYFARQLVKKPKGVSVPGGVSELLFPAVYGKFVSFGHCKHCGLSHDKYKADASADEDSDFGDVDDDAASDTSAKFDSTEGKLRPNRTMLYQATKNGKFLLDCDSDGEISDFSDNDLVNAGRVAQRHYYDRTKARTKHLRMRPGWFTDDEVPGRVQI